MRPLFAAFVVACAVCLGPHAVHAQAWNDPRTMALVDLAIARRSAQLADTGLADYRAKAHGYLTFLAQVGDGYPDPPKIVRTDELAVEVYWRAPNQSKQRIVGRRDTLLLPTDIDYHRDHLAIVQNNFPGIIRLGDGDEVRDVPHPLSPGGRTAYDFAITDSLRITTLERTYDVMMLQVRPKDDRQPRAVGAVYLDRASGSVVRMTFSFTRVALRDPQLEDVSIILESGLVDGRFWLPRRQEIEIRRTATWMDFPTRGIIRGRWEICCVEVNQQTPAPWFAGPEVVSASPEALRAYKFEGGILQHLPADTKLAENDDVRRVQDQARELVRAEALARTRLTVPSARGVSDIVRFDRNEGLALGGGVVHRFGDGVIARARARFGTGDHQLKHELSLGWQNAAGAGITITARDDWRDAGVEPEASGVVNSIAAQEFGTDRTDSYRARGVSLAIDAGAWAGLRWQLTLDAERQDPLGVNAHPASGAFTPAFRASAIDMRRLTLLASFPEAPGPWGTTVQGWASASLDAATAAPTPRRTFGRLALSANVERPFGGDRLVLHTTAAALTTGDAPAQLLSYFGGPVTGPGFGFHALRGTAGVSQRVEWRHPIGAIPLSLGRFGSLPMPVVLAPFSQVIALVPDVGTQRGTVYGAFGVGVISVFDLLRVDVARGFPDGRWTFSTDVSRGYWRLF